MFFSNFDIPVDNDYLKPGIPLISSLEQFILNDYLTESHNKFILFRIEPPFDFFDKGILFNTEKYKTLIYLTKTINGVEIGRYVSYLVYLNIVKYFNENNRLPQFILSDVEISVFLKLQYLSDNKDNFVVWVCPATGSICATDVDKFTELKNSLPKDTILTKNNKLNGLELFPENDKVFTKNFINDQILFTVLTDVDKVNDPKYIPYRQRMLVTNNLSISSENESVFDKNIFNLSRLTIHKNLVNYQKPFLLDTDIYDCGFEHSEVESDKKISIVFTPIERAYLMNIALVCTKSKMFSYKSSHDIGEYLKLCK